MLIKEPKLVYGGQKDKECEAVDKIIKKNKQFLESKGFIVKEVKDKQEIRSGKHELVGMFFTQNKGA